MKTKKSYRACKLCGYKPTKRDEANVISQYFYQGHWYTGAACKDCRADEERILFPLV